MPENRLQTCRSSSTATTFGGAMSGTAPQSYSRLMKSPEAIPRPDKASLQLERANASLAHGVASRHSSKTLPAPAPPPPRRWSKESAAASTAAAASPLRRYKISKPLRHRLLYQKPTTFRRQIAAETQGDATPGLFGTAIAGS